MSHRGGVTRFPKRTAPPGPRVSSGSMTQGRDPMINGNESSRGAPMSVARRHRGFRAVAVVAVLGLATLAGCSRGGGGGTPGGGGGGGTPGGGGSGRYRSQVFTSVRKTANVVYSQAQGKTGGNVNLALDVYQPAGDTVTSRPALV